MRINGRFIMKQGIFKIISNNNIAKNTYKMVLFGDTSAITNAGTFVNVKLPSFTLRRPISVCDYDKNTLTLCYKVVGDGTKQMSELTADKELDILTGLGNGYKIERSGNSPLLIGGGVGVPPLYNLAKKLIARGITPKVYLGFNSKEEVFLEKEFLSLGLQVKVSTVDGSYGTKGFVTDLLDDGSYFYACGPMPMLKAIYNTLKINGEFSLEERMGCGFGACVGCTIQTKSGSKRVCKDGPVFERGDLLW